LKNNEEFNQELENLKDFVKEASNSQLIFKGKEVKTQMIKSKKIYKLTSLTTNISSLFVFGGMLMNLFLRNPFLKFAIWGINILGVVTQIKSFKKEYKLKNDLKNMDEKLNIIYDEIMDRVDTNKNQAAEIFPDILEKDEKRTNNRKEIAILLEEAGYQLLWKINIQVWA